MCVVLFLPIFERTLAGMVGLRKPVDGGAIAAGISVVAGGATG